METKVVALCLIVMFAVSSGIEACEYNMFMKGVYYTFFCNDTLCNLWCKAHKQYKLGRCLGGPFWYDRSDCWCMDKRCRSGLWRKNPNGLP